jgi:hypothetical protein
MLRSWPLLCLLAATGCATVSGPPPIPPGSGPPLYVARDASCRSDLHAHAVPGLASDPQFCRDLVQAMERALNDAGYRIVQHPDEPHAAKVHIFGQRSGTTDSDGGPRALLTVQVMIEAIGDEVERAVEDGSVADSLKQEVEVDAVARVIAEDLARSPRMRRANLIPRLEPPAAPAAASAPAAADPGTR